MLARPVSVADRELPERLLTVGQVASRLNVCTRQVYRLLRRDPTFPQPVRKSAKLVRWREADLNAWIAAQGKAPDDLRGRSNLPEEG
jgi:predicted DNA-binding transcriptional regulator AlpA